MSREIVPSLDERMLCAETLMTKGLAEYSRRLLQDRQTSKATRVPGTPIDPAVTYNPNTLFGRYASRELINRKEQHEIGSD